MIFSARVWFFLGFLFCTALIGAALYFQYSQGLDPCPLCISQRVAVLLSGCVFLAAVLHNPGRTGTRVYAVMGVFTSLAGAAVASRHVWLQHLPPDEVPACGPGFEYMFNNFPFTQTLAFMLSGTGDCAKVDWTLLGFSMPTWTLLCFVLMAAASLAQFWNVKTTAARTVLYRV